MSQFYGEVTGQAKTTATRRGSKISGMVAHIRGWHIGARVNCEHIDGHDVIRVYRTNGSSDSGNEKLLAELTQKPSKDTAQAEHPKSPETSVGAFYGINRGILEGLTSQIIVLCLM